MWPILCNLRVARNLGPPSSGPLAVCLMLFIVKGCTPLPKPDVESLLKQPPMSPDSVVLDVFFVRFPFGDPEINGPAWREIDEQHFSADCRRRLLSNGFRAGVLAGQLPSELSALLDLAGQQALPGEIHQVKATDLVNRPTVMRGHFQLRAGAQKEFALGQHHDELPVLLRPHGEVGVVFPAAVLEQVVYQDLADV